MNVSRVRCVLVGDDDVGKTCLLNSFIQNEPTSNYTSAVFDDCFVNINVNNRYYKLNLSDTSGQENFDCLRKYAYKDADVFLICFSVINRKSFDNVRDKWVPEITRICPLKPFLIVGTYIDLRNDDTVRQNNSAQSIPNTQITAEEGQKLANDLKAVKYVECSVAKKLASRTYLKKLFKLHQKVVLSEDDLH